MSRRIARMSQTRVYRLIFMAPLSRRVAVLFLVSAIQACAASSEGSSVASSHECLSQRTQLARALQAASELERQWRIMQREVEKSRRSVLERQRALASCERSPWTAEYSLPLHSPASDGHNISEVSAGGTLQRAFVRDSLRPLSVPGVGVLSQCLL